MRIEFHVDDSPVVAEVDLVAKTLRIGERTYPFTIVAESGEKVELDVAGERVVVEGWPPNNEAPTGRLSVNGEVVRVVGILRRDSPSALRPRGATVKPGEAPAATSNAGTPAEEGPGAVVRPPMPGKILEVRVAEGELVKAGQVLVVLEAMKMRNEVASPAEGRVADLRVAPGTSVRARDILLRVVRD